MQINKQKQIYIIFVGLFLVLNVFNTYFLTTLLLNKYIAPFPHTFIGEMTAIIGNLAVLMIFVTLGNHIFKRTKYRMIYLTAITFILNFFIFAFGVFTLFFGTALSAEGLIIFNNPAEGFASSTVREIFHELFSYYRIVVFIPTFALLGVTIWSSIKKLNQLKLKPNIKQTITVVLAIAILGYVSSSVFIRNFRRDLPVKSTIASYALQNYGVYPYYLGELLGIDYEIDLEGILEIENENDLAEAYQVYNKNQESYVNFFDGKTYSNKLTRDQAVEDLYVDPSIADGNNLNGILEGRNLVLIHLESFNHFLLEFMEKEAEKGNNEVVEKAVTFFDHMFEQSFVFENIYNNVGMGVSSDGELSILTGLNVTGNETLYWKYSDMPYELHSLVDYFNQEGYYTEAIHGDQAEFYNRDVVYPEMYGFDAYYSIDDFLRDGSTIEGGYLYDMVNNLYHVSPWISDFELADHVSNLGRSLNQPYFLFPITMMGHTPYDFGPYEDDDLYPDYEDEVLGVTKRYINYSPYYADIIKRFFIADGNTDQTLDNTAYVFYSDHGSDLKSGDVSKIMDLHYSKLHERKLLQQIVSFIYVPSDDEYVDYGDYQLRKGLLTGTQPLVRSEIDIYRTIVELFNLDAEGDLYFGVNGLSTEPTFALENRLEDVVTDQYFYSMRDQRQVYPMSETVDQNVYDYVLRYKLLSDYLLSTKDMQGQIEGAIADVYR